MCRTFGDIESKDPSAGGVKGAVVCDPEIQVLRVSEDIDYAFVACDGVFDVLTNRNVNSVIWETIEDFRTAKNQTQRSGHQRNEDVIFTDQDLAECGRRAIDNVLKLSLLRGSEDNVTGVLVFFRNLLEP